MNGETIEYMLKKLEQQNERIILDVRELKDAMPKMYVSKDVYNAQMADLERRVAILEASSSRVTWAILGAAGSVLFTVVKAFLGI